MSLSLRYDRQYFTGNSQPPQSGASLRLRLQRSLPALSQQRSVAECHTMLATSACLPVPRSGSPMSNLDDWPYKWFGFWSEHKSNYEEYPSIKEFICPEENRRYDLEKLLNYLRTAQCITATSRSGFRHPFTQEKLSFGTLCVRSDGIWQWFDDLPDYIEKYDVAIPTKFLQHIEANGYIPPPDMDEEEYMAIDFPKMNVQNPDH
jgi:hypothetical protein